MTSRLTVRQYAWGHGYFLDQKRVPGVTTICGALDKSGMVNAAVKEVVHWTGTHWAERDQMGAEEWATLASGAHRRVWDVARDNGTAVHLIAQRLIYGDPVPDEDKDGLPWSDDIRRMGEQLARFMDTWDVQPILVETPVFHEHDRWAGTLDLVADLKGGDRWLLDYKTSASGVWHETALQTCAYGNATHVSLDGRDVPMTPPARYGAIWVRPDFWELQPLTVTEDTYRVFRALHYVYEWKGQKREALVGDALPAPEEVVA